MQTEPTDLPVLNYGSPDLASSARAKRIRGWWLTALAVVAGFAIAFSSFLLLMWDRTYTLP